LADFSADWRVLVLAGMALLVGTGGAFAAWVLVKLIALVTNLVWFGRLDTLPAVMAHVTRTPWMVVPPVLGGLAIGLMARFGSEKIRGHGIPEAIEAFLSVAAACRQRSPCSSRSPRQSRLEPAARSVPKGRSS
jgi:CIC family chloride channel protein